MKPDPSRDRLFIFVIVLVVAGIRVWLEALRFQDFGFAPAPEFKQKEPVSTMSKRGWSVACLVALAAWLGAGCARESEYPNRPIVLICPWSAGGGTDRVSRQLAMLLEHELDVPVNVVNATGGAGVTGHTRGALARPDGYSLTMMTVELNMLHWRGLTSVSHKDFAPTVLLNKDAAALFVRADAPWKDAAELAEYIRNNRGKVNTSGTAHGGIWHLALAGWLQSVGLKPNDAIWISINGSAPSLQELIAGGVEAICCSLPEAKSLLDSGRIRCLGVMADERLGEFADVPTLKEQGTDWSVGGWRGVGLPAETPPAVVRKITETLTQILHGDEFKRFMKEAGFDWSFEGPEEFSATLARLDEQFGQILGSEAFQGIAKRRIGPMFFPSVLLAVGGAAALALGLTGGLRRDPEQPPLTRQGALRIAEVAAWIGLYLLFAERIGFILTCGLLLLALLARYRVRLKTALGVTVVLIPLAYQIFAVYLRVPLPIGWLGW